MPSGILTIAGEDGEIVTIHIVHRVSMGIMDLEEIIGEIMVTEITERIILQPRHQIQKERTMDLGKMDLALLLLMEDQSLQDLKERMKVL